MTRWVRGSGVLALSVATLMVSAGCVPLATYEDVKTKLATAQDVNLAAERKLRQADQELVELREKLKRLESGSGPWKDRIALLEQENQALKEQKDKLLAQLQKGAISIPFEGVSGPPVERDDSRPDRLILKGDLTFGSGSADLRDEVKAVLKQIADQIKTKYADKLIHIYGYTDRQEVEKTKAVNRNNWFLGARRANSVFEFLVAQGIPEDQFVLHAYGYLDEIEKGVVKSQRNRRVEFAISEKVF